MGYPAIDAVRRMRDRNPACWGNFALHIAVMQDWDCAGDTAGCVKRLDRILNSAHLRGHAPRNFDINWGYWMLDFFPEDEITPLFQKRAAVAAARREIEEAADKPEMRKVEPRSRRERRTA